MTKQQFIERINKIEAFLEERGKVEATLCSLLEDGFGVFTFGQELLKAYIADTAKLSKINKEAIEWFIYEAPLQNSKFQDRTCRYDDGFKMNVLTADDLWEFEKHEVKLKDNIKLIDNKVNESLSIPTDSSADDEYLYKKLVEDNYDIKKDNYGYCVYPKYNKPSIDLTKYFKDLDYDSLICFNLSDDFKERYKDEYINPNIIPNSVKSIGASTFANYSSLTSIIIPDSVKNIGNSAFAGCSSLESITIPNSVENIYSSAFANCSKLESITIPNGVKSIDYSAFANCSSLESITIPNSVEYINDSAFANCPKLESITIPNSVKYIDDSTFANCSKLESITIPNSVKSIGNSAFNDCPLKNIYIDKDNKYVIKKFERLGYKDNIKLIDNKVNESLSIPIDSSADDDYLYDMNYKQYVEDNYDIEKDNYGYCVSPKYNKPSIDLTKYFKDLDYDSLIYFKLSKEFKERYKDEYINPNIIPNGVKEIYSSAFAGCSSLESITIPNRVKNIGTSSFENCSSLESITIPNSVKNIYSSAFENCSSLESITIPNSVEYIYSSAFAGCSKLESITIPNGVKSIDYSAFANCPKLKDINIDKDNKYAINYLKELGYKDKKK